jgi:cbb3-type cytochrome oxidase subunit 1
LFSQVRRFIKTAIAFLFMGLALGAFVLVRRELYNIYPEPHLVTAHVHAVAVGFVMFLILGVALWLFPRAPKEDRRYSPALIQVSYLLLTAATAARFISEILRSFSTSRLLAWIIVLAGAGQVAGLAVYFWTMWTRIRPVGSQLREQAGERF